MLGSSKHFKPRNGKDTLAAYVVFCAFALIEQENPVQTQTGSIVEESGKDTCLLLDPVILGMHDMYNFD